MRINELLDRFEKDSPISVMARLTLDHLLDAARLDDLFARHAVQQKCGELLFSTVADLMALVAIKAKPSVHAAYKYRTKEEIGFAIKSIYNKLQGIELNVGRALVAETASELLEVLGAMRNALPAPVLRGYQTRIIDGNHLAGTEHRIKELRTLGAAALPGQCIPILDPDHRLMLDVIPCLDGHAGECTMVPEILDLVQPGEVWIGDRKFGTKTMMMTIALDKRSHFIFRHSLGNVPEWNTIGRQRKIGQVTGGVVYEQSVEIGFKNRCLRLRRITIKLDQPTRKGDCEIHLLTNLPQRVSTQQISSAYRDRWQIESAFGQLATTLNCEIATLGYPQAALFSFCMGLMMFNLMSTIKTAIAAGNRSPKLAEELSTYFIALHIAGDWAGFRVAIHDQEFRSHHGRLTSRQLAKELKRLGKQVNLQQIIKSKRGPKHPPPKRKSGNRGNHVATARILAESRATC